MQHFTPQSREETLAQEIAQAFQDENNIRVYIHLCKTYSETIIRRAFAEVKETPWERIRKSRGAFFTYLVKKYAREEELIENIGD